MIGMLVAAICFCSACGPTKITDSNQNKGNEKEDGGEMITVLAQLVEGNKKCVFDIFVLGFLPSAPYDGGENTIVSVESDEFKTFDELKNYVESIYCETESNRLLYGENGKAVYLESEGVFSTDVSLHGGMGYYVNWDDYEILVISQDEKECAFEIVTEEENIIDSTTGEKRIQFKAIKENDLWKLEKLVY
jgi:hypothetical protein